VISRLLLVAGVALAVAGCSTRDHGNPLDPENPDTGGEPRWLTALADDGAVDLSWEVPYYRDLDAVRLVSTGTGAVLWTGDWGPASFRHTRLTNGVEQGYRLDLVLNAGKILHLPEETATPGPDVPWIYDAGSGSVKRLTPDGRGVRFKVSAPNGTAVTADPDSSGVLVVEFFAGRVRLLDRSGRERWRVDTLLRPIAALRDSGGWWVADVGLGSVSFYDDDGGFVYGDSSFTYPVDLALSSAGGVWVADEIGPVARLVPYQGIAAVDSLENPLALAAAPGGGVWVADRGASTLLRLDPSGAETFRAGGYPGIEFLAADSPSGGVWAADRNGRRVVLVGGSGEEILSVPGFPAPASLAAAPDGSEVWVADPSLGRVVRLARDGRELSRSVGATSPVSVSVLFR
jgi:DNA-binding beta-propeller fold protein YncE